MDKYVENKARLHTLLQYETVCNSCNNQIINDELILVKMTEDLEIKYNILAEKANHLEKVMKQFSFMYSQTKNKLNSLYSLYHSKNSKQSAYYQKEVLLLLNKISYVRNGVKFNEIFNRAYINQQIIQDEQRAFNKYVKYEVKKSFGENILAFMQIRELDPRLMKQIKEKAFSSYLPKSKCPKEAWNSAMNSLRQVRHQKKKLHKSRHAIKEDKTH